VDRLGISLGCDETGALSLLQSFLAALVSNQAVFLISPKPIPLSFNYREGDGE
jgi:hypothetical protein